ncbi:MAG: hypothetical protein R3F59_30775 [Myxococcota bacterium]
MSRWNLLAGLGTLLLGLACAAGAPEPEAEPEPEPVEDAAPPCVGRWTGTVKGFDGDAFSASVVLTVTAPTVPSLEDIEGGACGELAEDWGRDGTCKGSLRRYWPGDPWVARVAPYRVQDCDASNIDLVCAGDTLQYRRKEGRFLIHGELRRAPASE